MYRTAAGQAGASTSGGSGWQAGQYAEQMRQQQLLMQQMAAVQAQQQQQLQTQVNIEALFLGGSVGPRLRDFDPPLAKRESGGGIHAT